MKCFDLLGKHPKSVEVTDLFDGLHETQPDEYRVRSKAK